MRVRKLFAILLALAMMIAVVPAFDVTALADKMPYRIYVDLTNQIVTVYDSGNVSESGIVRQMICTTGKSGTPTPTGTFYLPSKSRASERSEWYYFSKYKCYAKWAARIRGGILFHSVLYSEKNTDTLRENSLYALGQKASHGCVRLSVKSARWIFEHGKPGSTVIVIY